MDIRDYHPIIIFNCYICIWKIHKKEYNSINYHDYSLFSTVSFTQVSTIFHTFPESPVLWINIMICHSFYLLFWHILNWEVTSDFIISLQALKGAYIVSRGTWQLHVHIINFSVTSCACFLLFFFYLFSSSFFFLSFCLIYLNLVCFKKKSVCSSHLKKVYYNCWILTLRSTAYIESWVANFIR